jgi:hypothetical protein
MTLHDCVRGSGRREVKDTRVHTLGGGGGKRE